MAAKKRPVKKAAPAGEVPGKKARSSPRAKAAAGHRLEPAASQGAAGKLAHGVSSGKPRGMGEASAKPLAEGDPAPSFELLDQEGARVSSDELAGRAYVLYFYPKDDTPGCTVEASGFRDAYPAFESAGVRVIGVSPDSVASHQKFVTKHHLPFTLLSDGEQRLATAYGSWALKKNYGREYMGVVRSTFLVGRDGRVKKAWRGVRVNGHVAAVQAAAEQLG